MLAKQLRAIGQWGPQEVGGGQARPERLFK